ncbi:MAG: hypothetical protein EPN97_18430 [Alphaproteobacteria bacterium]|nr:MAG: hypothetical protein EPN97_18430 [Alphaproteobacteria bacterium]
MKWFWNWGGECFGYQIDDCLFTYRGLQIGKFHGDEVYGANGIYLGEVLNDSRLITHHAKKHWRRESFTPVRSGSYMRYMNYMGYMMYAGYEDFPAPREF